MGARNGLSRAGPSASKQSPPSFALTHPSRFSYRIHRKSASSGRSQRARVRAYVFSVMAHGLKVLADLFAVRGHVLKKWLFFRFAYGVRPYKPHSAGSVEFVKAADPERQPLLRLDPLIQLILRVPKCRP